MPRLYVMVCLYIKINYQINYGNIFLVILHSYAFSHRPSAHLCMPASCLLPYVFHGVVLHNKGKTKFILTLTLFYIKYEKNKEKRIQ